jgi:hypothetical protein
MNTSLFIAQLFGFLYTVVGIGIFLNQKYYQKLCDEMLKSPLFLYIGGAIDLSIGFVIVTFHNYWVSDWRVLITLIGWIALGKGVLLLIWPQSLLNYAKWWMKRMQLVGTVSLLLGLILGYFGFVA